MAAANIRLASSVSPSRLLSAPSVVSASAATQRESPQAASRARSAHYRADVSSPATMNAIA
jgi:hypothetical protein